MSPELQIILVILAILFGVAALLLVVFLAPVLSQLRLTLADLEKTSAEARELVTGLQSVTDKVNEDLVKVDHLIDSTKETVDTAKHSLQFVNKNLLKYSSGIMAWLPAIKFGWGLIKKFKRR